MKPPLFVVLVSILFIVAGISGIIYHAPEWNGAKDLSEVVLPFIVRLLAIIGGVFAWRGANWARWLLVAWIVYHVVLSFYHSIPEVAMHIIFTVIIVAGLFNRKAGQYYKSKVK